MSALDRLADAMERIATALEERNRLRRAFVSTPGVSYEPSGDEPDPVQQEHPALAGLLELGVRPDLARSLAECGVSRETFAPKGGRRKTS